MRIAPAVTGSLLTLLACSSVNAQVDRYAIKMEQLKWVPATVRLQTPPKVKTLEIGTAPIGPEGRSVLLHLYSDPQHELKHHCDLFVRGKNEWIRVNRVSITQAPVDMRITAPVLPGFDTPIVWLDDKHHKVSVIPLKVPDASGHDQGNIWLFTFPKGVNQKPIVQKFEYYSGLQEDQVIYLDTRDKRGFIVVKQYWSRTGGGPDYVDSWQKLYYWDGQKFVQKSE